MVIRFRTGVWYTLDCEHLGCRSTGAKVSSVDWASSGRPFHPLAFTRNEALKSSCPQTLATYMLFQLPDDSFITVSTLATIVYMLQVRHSTEGTGAASPQLRENGERLFLAQPRGPFSCSLSFLSLGLCFMPLFLPRGRYEA